MLTLDFDSSSSPTIHTNTRHGGKLSRQPLVVSVRPQLNHPLTGIGLNNPWRSKGFKL